MRVVFFDIGSTLVTGPSQGPASRIAVALGLGSDQKLKLQSILMTKCSRSPAELGVNIAETFGLDRDLTTDVIEEIWEGQISEAQQVEGAGSCMRQWAEAGSKIGLISNIWQPYLVSVQELYRELFDEIVPVQQRIFSFEVGSAKPSASIFEIALRAAGCFPSEALMVGDSYKEDIQAAAAVGLRTAWVLHRADSELDSICSVLNGTSEPPDVTVRSIADFTPEFWNRSLEQTRDAEALVSAEQVTDDIGRRTYASY